MLLTGLALLLRLTSTTPAQENGELGRMWLFEHPPLDYLEDGPGFKPDQAWLDALRLGALRIGGEDLESGVGSASFVSPHGLILTSTRCVRGAVTATRPKDLDILNAGFVAATPEREFRLRARHDEWLTAAQLIGVSIVTSDVDEGVLPTDDDVQRLHKREANRRTLLDAARRADPEHAWQMVSLYQGAAFHLYKYKVYDDLRLVVLPHVQIAHFGGDRDDFTYPRHSLDFAFLRAYEDGKPVDTTEHHFRWKPGGASEDELVFVSGNPGTTMRSLTKAQIGIERDITIPIEIERLTNSMRILMDPRGGTYSGEFDPENPSRHWAWMRTNLLEMENALKAARGHLQGLCDPELMTRKAAAEQAFERRVMADRLLAKHYGSLWERIARVVEERRPHEVRARFQTPAGSPVLDVAVAIVRLSDPAETEEHRTQARETLESWGAGTISPNFHGTAHGLDHLVRARNWLPENDPFLANVLGGKSPAEFVDALDARSPNWIGYPNVREATVMSGWQAIHDSDDPALLAARELVPLMRKNEQLGRSLDAKEAALGADLARALFACYGMGVSPDGTGTLRFTDGVVRGFTRNGTAAPHRTTFGDLYARSAEFAGEYPFNLPQAWHDRRETIDMTTTVNFVSTNDISIGSAGSVVVNQDLGVVGVVVDGNSESLWNDVVFRDDVARTVSVHVDGIMEALVKVYDAQRIAAELTDE